jgi:hypothetical protein
LPFRSVVPLTSSIDKVGIMSPLIMEEDIYSINRKKYL